MKTLTVKREGTSTEFSYEIVWDGSYERLAGCVENLKLPAKKACIVTDSTVSELYLEEVKNVLSPLFETVTAFVFPAGEASKNLDTVKDLYTHLIENHFERKDILFALGGGVVGDLTGYAAATYLRGIDFIQLPTTLLAQVDSSVGGKTGVDFDQYKNMVGAFHHPRLVYMNMATLKSLNGDQFACGMGEVLKTGLIRDEKFYVWTINHMSEIEERIEPVLTKMIQKCCDIKRQVVENDPTEQGERAVLNLGHTIGHAIEKLKNFELLHGQCVALGTVAAAYISYKRSYLSDEEFYEIRDMNVGFYLPITVDGLKSEDILAAIGPSICQECYEVSEDVIEEFKTAFAGEYQERLYYKKKNGKYKRQTNFISYIRRVAQDYENSDLFCYPEQQMHHLRKKIKHRYRNANKNILPNPND